MRCIAAAVLLLLPVPSGTWSELAGSASTGGVSNTPDESGSSGGLSLAADANGWPVLAWAELGATSDILVRRWNGDGWTDLAGAAEDPTAFNVDPCIVLSPTGPVLAYRQSVGAVNEIRVRLWNGAAWQTLGSLGATATATRPALAVDSLGNPVLAWGAVSSTGKSQIFLATWNGSAWVGTGGSFTGEGVSVAGAASDPAIAIGASDAPIVAYRKQFSTGIAMALKVWDGAAWVGLGSSATGAGLSNIILVSGSGGGGVAGGGGSGGGGGGTVTVSSGAPSVTVDATGAPIVAWSDLEQSSMTHEIYLKRWNGTAWTGLGGSENGGGISQSTDLSMDASVAVAPDGTLMVAWREGIGTSDIRLRAWDGSAWVELDGSATGGGLSATAGESLRPQLAIGSAGVPLVAWSDVGGGNWDVYLKSWSDAMQGLDQRMLDGTTSIAVGQTTPEDGLTLTATVSTAALGATQAALQVELRPVGTPFDGTVTHESAMVPSGSTVSVTASTLATGGWHWRARMKSDTGALGAWTSFGGNTEADNDVVIQTAGGGGGGGGGGNGGGSGSGSTPTGKGRPKRDGCTASAGAMAGSPLLLVLGLLVACRRRRTE